MVERVRQEEGEGSVHHHNADAPSGRNSARIPAIRCGPFDGPSRRCGDPSMVRDCVSSPDLILDWLG